MAPPTTATAASVLATASGVTTPIPMAPGSWTTPRPVLIAPRPVVQNWASGLPNGTIILTEVPFTDASKK